MADTVKAVVLFDRLSGYDVAKGDEVELSAAEFERLSGFGAVAKAGKSGASEGGWPGSHKELDALAAEHGVEFSAAKLKVDEKIVELEAAGVAEPAASDES